jgi:hypothetical protein
MFERLIANSDGPPEGQLETGCWPWTGRLHNSNYGVLSVRVPGRPSPTKVFAHREMEQLIRDNAAQLEADMAESDPWLLGPTVKAPPLDPEDETIDHHCCWRRCVNFDHWTTVTRARNSALMQERKKLDGHGRLHPESTEPSHVFARRDPGLDRQQQAVEVHRSGGAQRAAVGRSQGAAGDEGRSGAHHTGDWDAARAGTQGADQPSTRLRPDRAVEPGDQALARERV